MYIIHIEHSVPNFDAWKKEGFDNDPLDRMGSGVTFYRIFQPVDNSIYVMIDLGFDSREKAESMLQRLKVMWGNVSERFGWTESPKATISKMVEEKQY